MSAGALLSIENLILRFAGVVALSDVSIAFAPEKFTA